jgi:hypothetical protein
MAPEFVICMQSTSVSHDSKLLAVLGDSTELFGEVAGAAFSPDGEALFVSVADRTYGGLLEFRRRRAYCYLDSCFF